MKNPTFLAADSVNSSWLPILPGNAGFLYFLPAIVCSQFIWIRTSLPDQSVAAVHQDGGLMPPAIDHFVVIPAFLTTKYSSYKNQNFVTC